MNIIASASRIELIETAVSFGPRTRLICDAHDILFGDAAFDADRLIADQARGAIHAMGVPTLGSEVRVAASDKKAARLLEAEEPLEIQEPSIHGVERTGLGQQQLVERH
jgi:hypothetical protein